MFNHRFNHRYSRFNRVMAVAVTFFLFLLFSVSFVYGKKKALLLILFPIYKGCSSGSVRLYNQGSVSQTDRGAVQYCYSGYWYSACHVGWDCPEANVVCRQLGYLGASKNF